MTPSIAPLTLARPDLAFSPPPTAVSAPAGFGELLQQTVAEVDRLNAAANSTIQRGLLGDDLPLVETFTAVREADLALRLLLQVRNKLVDAYQELQQMRF
jgi:flagellar hook-basal body complex protein FliE